MALNKDDILSWLEQAKIKDIVDLVSAIEEKFGVSAVVAAAPASGGAAGGAEEEVQSEFDVILKDAGAQKIAVIKEVRAITNLGLKEAKDLVEAGGKTLKESVTKEEAEDIKKKLEAAGASVEIK